MSLRVLSVVFYFVIIVRGQWMLPKLPELPKLPQLSDLSKLPTPQMFLQELLNVTTKELLDTVRDFAFDEILSRDIQFLLYNKNGSVTALDTFSNRYHITNSSVPIKFVIHGWQSTGDHDFVRDIAKSYHKIGIYNVFGVDWSPHSKRSYLHSARGTKKVGEIVGEFIMGLIKRNKKLLRNVHLIGHSLGAQVAGFAGKHIRDVADGLRIGRITGLDAAAPLFEVPITMPNDMRLINDDADYVDGMHTNSGFFGFLSPFGDADFYVGYGSPIQAGCMDINVFEAFVCSHIKSYDLFAKTITSTDYVAIFCDNPIKALAGLCKDNRKVIMGEHTAKDVEGDFFINVDGENGPEKKRSIRDLFKKIPVINKMF